MVREKPILFSSDMVRAILESRKTQTRRIVKPCKDKQIGCDLAPCEVAGEINNGYYDLCPFGKPGDRLYVRETFADVNTEEGPAIAYRADGSVQTWHEFSETFGPDFGAGPSMDYESYPGEYCMWWSDLLNGAEGHNWRPSIHMPKWAARIWLEITDIGVERLQDISEEDADAEGFGGDFPCRVMPNIFTEGDDYWGQYSIVECFKHLWESINGPDSWGANPWIWAIKFKRLDNPHG